MPLVYLLLLLIALFLVIKSSGIALKYSKRIATELHISKFIVGILVVAILSVLPEMFISITSAIEGSPALGLGILFGSNVADLSLVLALVILVTGHELKAEAKLIKRTWLHVGILAMPLVLGLNGHYSRIDGVILMLTGLLFYFISLHRRKYRGSEKPRELKLKNALILLASIGVILFGAHYTVNFGIALAQSLKISPIIIGMFVVALGTTLPELFFSIKAARSHDDGLAIGDILGTVVIDATILIGILALIKPFTFNSHIVYITGCFMLLAAILMFHFIKTGRRLSKKEAAFLILFYVIFVITELTFNLKILAVK